jgi:hypothetical protein
MTRFCQNSKNALAKRSHFRSAHPLKRGLNEERWLLGNVAKNFKLIKIEGVITAGVNFAKEKEYLFYAFYPERF